MVPDNPALGGGIHIVKLMDKGRGVLVWEEEEFLGESDETEQTGEEVRLMKSIAYSITHSLRKRVATSLATANLSTVPNPLTLIWMIISTKRYPQCLASLARSLIRSQDDDDSSKNKSSLTTTSKLGFPLALLLTCKSIAAEATAVLYSENHFCIEDTRTCSYPEAVAWSFTREIGTANAAHIKDFTIGGKDKSVLSVPRLEGLLDTFPSLKRATLGGMNTTWNQREKRPQNTLKFLKLAKRILSTHCTLRHIASKHPMGYHFVARELLGTIALYEEVNVAFLENEKGCQREDGTLFDIDEAIRGWNEEDRAPPL